jgi:hypothetical protein
MPATLEEPAPNSIEYARAAAPVTRRQFRRLYVLTLLNTILLATFVCGPALSQFSRNQWQAFQNRQQIRKALQQRNGLIQQAAAFTLPTDQVIYEEDPVEAARLTKSSPDYAHLTERLPLPKSTTQPAYRILPPFASQFRLPITSAYANDERLILLHTLRNPAGQDRLVWISYKTILKQQLVSSDKVSTKYEIKRSHSLIAWLVEETPSSGIIPSLDTKTRLASLEFRSPRFLTTAIWTKSDNPNEPHCDFEAKGVFRIYAAKLDPANPAHFTIDYAIDGQRSTIDGYLKANDTIQFLPRTGQRLPDGPPGWDPFPSPATAPSR